MNGSDERREHLVVALRLSWFSVAWGIVSGGLSVVIGVLDDSLGVVALGLNALADVTGSTALVWRFRAESRHGSTSAHFEERAALVVAIALATVSIVLAVSGVEALVAGSHPGHSTFGVVMAAIAVLVFTPLAVWKRRVAAKLGSRALRGDAALSGVSGAVGVLALLGLWLNDAFGWWWADRIAALAVAGIAAFEAARAARE
jgi:divalent metal cation (Fe/Co/Zn/Cd) transporter